LVSANYLPRELDLRIYQGDVSGIAKSFSLPDWEILSWKMDNSNYTFTTDGHGQPAMTFTITAKRYVGYYVFKFIIPLLFVVSMSYVAFWISIKDSATRIGVTTSAMLTIIAFRFVITTHLPNVSYLTYLDYIVLLATVTVFISLVLATLISYLVVVDQQKAALRLNRYSRNILPLVFFLALVVVPLLLF
ncbi:MAG: hypothetical protein KDH94_07220, partial [Coxiellaceae bacterium]|nr:hypothetical protein [Coxiellaceae bacterium]